VNCRLVIIGLLLALAAPSGPAHAWPPADGGYRPTPGAEKWLYEMLAHKLRLDNSAIWILEEYLQKNPATAAEFASINRVTLLRAVALHDYSKVHPDQMRGRLPFNEYLPELFDRFIRNGIKPAAEGSVRADMPRGKMSPEQEMRWVVDRMNDSDGPIESKPLQGLSRREAAKYRFIIFLLDSLDTSLMRGDITAFKGTPPSDFVQMKQAEAAFRKAKLAPLGPFAELVIPALKWAEEKVLPEPRWKGEVVTPLSRYVLHNRDFSDDQAIPILRLSECFREKIRVRDLLALPAPTGG
jgi:hypothetical protein